MTHKGDWTIHYLLLSDWIEFSTRILMKMESESVMKIGDLLSRTIIFLIDKLFWDSVTNLVQIV